MLRAFEFERRSDFAALEVKDFAGADRLPRAEWQRRWREQTALLEECRALEIEVRAHLVMRYFGAALEEWLTVFFDGHQRNLSVLGEVSRAKLRGE